MNHPLLAPARVTTTLRHVSPCLLGSKEGRNAFADAMLQREREYQEAMEGLPEQALSPADVDRLAAIDDERHSEGRVRVRAFAVNIHD